MEAKDTIRLCPTTPAGWRVNCIPDCHEIQAEISFKAGIREVVEYLNERYAILDWRVAFEDEWQIKLKEWGIEKES